MPMPACRKLCMIAAAVSAIARSRHMESSERVDRPISCVMVNWEGVNGHANDHASVQCTPTLHIVALNTAYSGALQCTTIMLTLHM